MFLKFIEKPVWITTPPSSLRIAFDQRPTDLYIHFTGSAQSAVLGVRNKGNGRGQKRKEYRVKTVTGIMLNNLYLWNIYYIWKAE